MSVPKIVFNVDFHPLKSNANPFNKKKVWFQCNSRKHGLVSEIKVNGYLAIKDAKEINNEDALNPDKSLKAAVFEAGEGLFTIGRRPPNKRWVWSRHRFFPIPMKSCRSD